jgi:hypothetical protein
MSRGHCTLTIPFCEDDEIGAERLARILDDAGISEEEWERAE